MCEMRLSQDMPLREKHMKRMITETEQLPSQES